MKKCPFCGNAPELRQAKQSVDSNGNYVIAWQVLCGTCSISFSATDVISRTDDKVNVIFDGRARVIEMWDARAGE